MDASQASDAGSIPVPCSRKEGRNRSDYGFCLFLLYASSVLLCKFDYKIPLNQIPSGKHTSGGYHLGHVNGYHHNISVFMYPYHGVSSKFLDYYLALFYWVEKNKGKPISFDMKRLVI